MQRNNLTSSKKREKNAEKNGFSDDEIYEEIRDQIREIKEQNINEVQKIQKIHELYKEHKQSKKRRKIIEKGAGNQHKYSYDHMKNGLPDSQSDQPGEINEQLQNNRPLRDSLNKYHDNISAVELGQLIRQITLTRRRLIDFLDNRKFEDLVKGCFVRYKSESSNDKESYIVARIIGVKTGTKQYVLTPTHKTKLLLVLQQSSLKVVDLPIEMVSNQLNKGNVQITKWTDENRYKVPKQRELRQKLEQHNRLLTEQLSSQQIDKNIETRAIQISKGEKQVKSYEEIQNLIEFIGEKLDNYEAMEEEQIAKRKDDKLELIQIRRKKHEYQEVRKGLEERKKTWVQKRKGQGNMEKGGINPERTTKADKAGRTLGQAMKFQEKREDTIKEKCRLREVLLSTAQGYERIKIAMLENHAKFDIEIDV